MHLSHRAIRSTCYLLLALLIGAMTGMLVERNWLDADDSPEFSDLEEVVEIVESDYFYRPVEDDAFEDQLEHNAISGLLSGLGDNYTTYLDPPESQALSDTLEGRTVGIGVAFIQDGTQPVIARVYPKTAAEEQGLQTGDIVLRVNGRPVSGMEWSQFLALVEGAEGTEVTLTLVRTGTPGSFNVTLERRAYEVPSVAWRMIENTTFAWIQIGVFSTRTTAEFDAAITEAVNAGATTIILDLRGNPGGWVQSAREVIGRFVPAESGPALYEDTTPGRGDEEPRSIINDGPELFDMPLIVLANSSTASAAEIVAGALRDYDRAMLVGEQTFGKGSVQRVYDFANGASFRITVAEWLTPSKGRIQDEGINPDVQITVSDQSSTTEDVVLNAAVSLAEQGISRPSDLSQPATPET